jgi:PAS domain S-box-containing protein
VSRPLSTSVPATQKSTREELQDINGLLVTMSVIFGLVGVLWHNINLFYLPLVLVLAVTFSSYAGGTIQGLLSAGLASVFLWFYLFAFRTSPREWLTNSLVWSGVLTGVALLTGYLQRRAREQEFKPWKGNVAPFRIASESLRDLAVVLLDRSGKVTTWNTGAERLFGWKADEMSSQSMARCCEPDEVLRGRPEEALKTAAQQGSFEGEWKCTQREANGFRAKIAITALHDERGQLAGYTLSAQDLSERQLAAAALLHRAHQQVAVAALSQAALAGRNPRDLLEHAVTFIMQTGAVDCCEVLELQPDGRTLIMRAGAGWKDGCVGSLTLEAGASSILGYAIDSSEPVILKDLTKITRFQVPEHLLERGITHSLLVAMPGRPYPFGVLGVHTVKPVEFGEGDISFLQSVASVLASAQARRDAEAELAKLAAFPQFNPNPVLELSRDGLLSYYNDAASRMASSLRLSHTSQMLPPDTAAIVQECLATGTTRLGVETHSNGRTLHWSFHPIPQIGRVHLYAMDVTERLSLEAQLRQSQKMEAIGHLAAGVAHDFNNILTIMQGYACRLLHRETLPKPGEEAQEILNATERAASLTRQLLTFSRRQTLQRRLLDLREVVLSMARMLQRLIGEHIRLEVVNAEVLPPVSADSGMMEQILLNLVVNARDAMPEGGPLLVETMAVEIHQASRHSPQARTGRFVCLKVKDTGCGMDAETLARIFDPFFTTKGPGRGTGLGLATVYGIVQQHQGWIEVQSQVGQGTTFTVFLPAGEGSVETRIETESAAPPQGGQETILVVEDEELLRALARATLEEAGYHVLDAASGPEALLAWEQHSSKVDLLLTDLVMPGGMTGRELCTRLRQEKPELRVIFSSGYSADDAGTEFTEGPGLTYLQKPYRPPLLAQTVRKCLDMKPEPPAS